MLNFIKNLEKEKEKKRVSELNLLITKLKEILAPGIRLDVISTLK